MPKGPNFQLPARLNSARGPSRLQPPQGNKSFVRPPSGLMQSWLLAKSGKQSRGESAGAGVDVLWVSPDKWAPRPAGRPGPLSPGRQHRQQTSPPAPRPARPPPAPSAPCCPAQRPAGRPGLPPRSRLPGRGKLPGAEVQTKRPSPEPLGTHAAAAAAAAARRSLLATEPPAARAATRPQGAWEKPAPPLRGAPPHRSGQRQAALTRARAGQQLRRPDSGAVAITATTLDSPRGDPALMPPLPPGEPWRTSTQQQAGLG